MKKSLIAILCAALGACAAPQGASYVPLIDLRPGQDSGQMQRDVYACQQFANQRLSAGQAAVAGALFGAVLGAALGAAAGGHGRFNGQMAGIGAIGGGVGAAGGAEMNQRAIIMRCMVGRGYNVLG